MGLAMSSVRDTSSVSTMRSRAAASARPVSVISTTASAMSGILASVAPYDMRISACTPCFSSTRRVSSGYSVDTRAPDAQVGDGRHGGIHGDRQDHADGIGRWPSNTPARPARGPRRRSPRSSRAR